MSGYPTDEAYYAQQQPQQQQMPAGGQVRGAVYGSSSSNEYYRGGGNPNSAAMGGGGANYESYTNQPYESVQVEGPYNSYSSGAMPVQRPPSMMYNTPPCGSLGTPHIGSNLWARTPKGRMPRGAKGSFKGNSADFGERISPSAMSASGTSPHGSPNVGNRFSEEELAQITLVPTRPLLKALAKQCKPQPPWCVGCPPGTTVSLDEEMTRFGTFLQLTSEESAMHETCAALMQENFRDVWPDCELCEMAATAAGQSRRQSVTAHYFVTNSVDAGEQTQSAIREAVVGRGGQVQFCTDDRGIPAAVCTDSRTGRRSCIRYGERAPSAAASAQLLRSNIAEVDSRRHTYVALLALLEQNKILDDSGTQRGLLSGESVAVMLLAVVNSYNTDDYPSSGRLLLDFFLTFGFQSNFNFITSSVTLEGMRKPVPKVHTNAQLDVVDPGDSNINLTPHLDRVANLQAVFNYCYTALSQYQQVSSNQRRAQSALSTILGGEPYWGRVLTLYNEGVEPFYATVQAKKGALALAL